MTRDLFTYGTLMSGAVMAAVAGRVPDSRRAALDGHRRFRVPGADYPAIVPDAAATVAGRLYFDLSDAELARLDRYESDLYVRRIVPVRTDDGAVARAHVYLLSPDRPELVGDEPWREPGYSNSR